MEHDPILDRMLREDFGMEPEEADDELRAMVRNTFGYQARKLDDEARGLGLVGRRVAYEFRGRIRGWLPSLFGPRGDEDIE